MWFASEGVADWGRQGGEAGSRVAGVWLGTEGLVPKVGLKGAADEHGKLLAA